MTTIALITGANKGIGYATARLLGARGMTVLAAARDEALGLAAEAALRKEGADAHFVPLDVTDEASIRAAADRVEAEYGRLDVLINNAGIARGDGHGRPSETTLATLRTVYETNVFGVAAVTNAMLPLLRRAPAARIVNVSSEVGSIASMSDQDSPMWPMASLPYPSSKTALNMVTVMYAKELWDTPIKVNAANPGYCATDLNRNSGFRTAEQGAEVSVHLATLPADGPTGVLWGFLWRSDGSESYGVLPW
jgi:NAD(P)-dependent dehydrogenase (short-subunit alcohol dehydrogenase family)